MKDLEAQLQEVKEGLQEALYSYDIWWELSNKESHTQHLETLNRYIIFFQSTTHAHFLTVVITLYRLFERKTNTVNLPGIFQSVREQKLITEEADEKIQLAEAEIKKNWEKICILRSNVFGHRNRKHSTKDFFKKAGITPDQIKLLISHMQDVINLVAGEALELEYGFSVGAGNDTKRLLSDLSQLKR